MTSTDHTMQQQSNKFVVHDNKKIILLLFLLPFTMLVFINSNQEYHCNYNCLLGKHIYDEHHCCNGDLIDEYHCGKDDLEGH